MRLLDLFEKFDPHSFGVIGPGPDLYVHFTHDEESARSIIKNGFDLRRFGETAKRFGMASMAANDPAGVYAVEKGDYVPDRPHVIFRVSNARVLSRPDSKYPGESADLKTELARATGKRGKPLSDILLKNGVDVLHSTSEFIILDPRKIVIIP